MTTANKQDITGDERALLGDEGQYERLVRFDSSRTAAVVPFLFTWAIIADLSEAGYEDRWCYHSLAEALGALEDWDGTGEPEGWHRHPNTGRRRDGEGNDLGTW